MSDQAQSGQLQRPTTDDQYAWNAYWRAQGQPWRTEPEIDEERQQLLAECRATTPDIGQGIYPFKDITLTRADVEWLLATHEDHYWHGPVDWSDESQRYREGLDLRGADLRGVWLTFLPLARIRVGLSDIEWEEATPEQREMAAAHLEKAALAGSHLEEADLNGAHLEEAALFEAHLVAARFRGAHLEGANLGGAHLEGQEGARLNAAHLEGADLFWAHLESANLDGAHLEGADLRLAHLEQATLDGTHLEGAELTRAHLEGTFLLHVHLEGAVLFQAHLEGAALHNVHLEGTSLPHDDLERVRRWKQDFPETLPPADLQGMILDASTRLVDIIFGDLDHEYASLVNVVWGGADLSGVYWDGVRRLGDERQARRRRTRDGKRKDTVTRREEFMYAVWANRQLATALRGQGMSEYADRYSYRAQVLQRQVFWRQLLQVLSLPGYIARGKMAELEYPTRGLPQSRVGQFVLWLVIALPFYSAYLLGRLSFSLFLDVLAGYGHKPGRSLAIYVLVIAGFAAGYYSFGPMEGISFSPLGAAVFSVTSFHGRGFFPGVNPGYSVPLDNPLILLAALEAIMGLVIEISFIATFTQRFFAR